MTLLVGGGAAIYFGTLWLQGLRPADLRVAAPDGRGSVAVREVTMELVRGLHNLRPRHRGCVATIGNYDGVHRGHQHMLAALRRRARELALPATLITFEPTPREYFEGADAPARLTRLREKLQALAQYGVDRVICLRFDAELASISAASFEADLLAARLGVKHMVVGHDFHYSRGRAGTTRTLRAAGERLGFSVEEVPPFEIERSFASAARSYALRSRAATWRLQPACSVVRTGSAGACGPDSDSGASWGFRPRTLPLHRKVIPLWGIFAVRVDGPGLVSHPAVASLGTRPTFDGTVPLLEVHLFDFDAELYRTQSRRRLHRAAA